MAILVAEKKLETETACWYKFVVDTPDDIANLPTSESFGESYQVKKTAKCASVAYCISTTNVYMLDLHDEWRILAAIPSVELEAMNIKAQEIITYRDEAKQAAASAIETLETFRQERAEAAEKIETAHENAAREIEEKKTSAVDSVKAAHSSAIEEIASTKTESVTAVTTAHQEALDEIEQKKTAALEEVGTAHQTALDEIEQDKTSALTEIEQKKTASVKDVSDVHTLAMTEISASVETVNTAKQEAVESAESSAESANKALLSQQAAEEAKAQVQTDAESVKENTGIVQSATETVNQKAEEVSTNTEKVEQLTSGMESFASRAENAAEDAETSKAILEKWAGYYQISAVGNLPEVGDEKVMYLSPEKDGVYACYIYKDGAWGSVGGTKVDLSGYCTEEQVNDKIDELSSVAFQGIVQDEDGDYWLINDKDEKLVKLPFTGGGSGGGGTSVSITNETTSASGEKVLYLTIAKGNAASIRYIFADSDPDFGGVASYYVNGALVVSQNISQGTNEWEATQYLSVGENKVKVTVEDENGSRGSKTWTIMVLAVSVTATLNQSKIYGAGDTIRIVYVPVGVSMAKTTHFLVDGSEVATTTTTASGRQSSQSIIITSHGAHDIDLYVTAEHMGTTVQSEKVHFCVAVANPSSTVPIITVIDKTPSGKVQSTASLQYLVYDPRTETAETTLTADGESTVVKVDRTMQVWAYKPRTAGEHTLTLTCGKTIQSMTFTADELDYDITPVTEGLIYDFDPAGRSNAVDDRATWESQGVSLTVSDDFDWVNGGYQQDANGDTAFVVKSGSRAVINYKLFGVSPKTHGANAKFIYTVKNAKSFSADVISCVSGGVGLSVTANRAALASEQTSIEVPLCEGEYTELEYNITGQDQYSEMFLVVGAVPSRFTTYTETDRLHQSESVNVTIGSDDCDVWLYRAKAYNLALTDNDLMDNYIADAPNADEIMRRYEDNQICDEDGAIDPDKLSKVKPWLRVLKIRVPRFTTDKGDKVSGCSIQHILQGGRPADNWTCTKMTHSGQGTTSNAYGLAARNIDIDCEGFTFADGSTGSTYAMTEDSIGESYFNIKLNVASSECANNAVLAMLFNKYNPHLRDCRKADPRIRDTMEFHPCAVFVYNESDEQGFEQGQYMFYGVGDFGNSKKNRKAFGLDASAHPNEVIVELCDNTSPCNRYKDGSGIEEESFWESSAYPNAPLSWRYIPDTCDKAVARKAWADVVSWVASCDPTQATNNALDTPVRLGGTEYATDSAEYRKAKFKAEFDDHFVSDSVMYQYCFTTFFLMPDNRAKNTFPHCEDVTAEKPLWDFDFDYDNDTALGINNEGDLKLDYGKEDVDTIDGGNVYNAQDSVLWCNVRELFADRLRTTYGGLTELWEYNRLISTFEEYADVRPVRLMLADARRKYIRPYEELKSTEGSPITMFISMLNGDKKLQRRYFLKFQCPYIASKFNSPVTRNDKITLRGFASPDGTAAHLSITPYADIYVSALFGSVLLQERCKAGDTVTLTVPESTTLNDTEVYIYSASMLDAIEGIETVYTNQMDFASATRLTKISIGSDAEGYSNPNLQSSIKLDFSALKNLEELHIDGCPNLKAPLDVSGCVSLRKITAKRTPVSAVVFAPGGRVEQVVLESPSNIVLRSMQNIKVWTINDGYAALTGFREEDTPFPAAYEIVRQASGLKTLRLTGINWTLDSTSLLNRLMTLEGCDSAGVEIEQSVLTGTAHITELRSQELAKFQATWPDLKITYDTLIQQYAVSFLNYDGTKILNKSTKEPLVIYVDRGGTVIDPVQLGMCDTPTKPATTTEIYKWSGWDGSLTNITADKSVTATFTAITQHAVTFLNYDGSAIIGKDGEPLVIYVERSGKCPEPVSSGLCDTPVRADTVAEKFTWSGWDGVLTNVTADRTLTATYTSVPQQYQVTWMSEGETVATAQVDYDTEAVCPLEEDPTRADDPDNHIYYLFASWDRPTTRVLGAMTVNAVWTECTLPDKGTALENMNFEQLYAVKKAGLLSEYVTITEDDVKDRIPVTLGWEPTFNGIESKVLAEDLELTGDVSVDTGIKLLDEDRDWTLMIDGTFDSDTDGACMASCYTADGYHGFQVIYSQGFAVRWGSVTASNSMRTSMSSTTVNEEKISYVSAQYRELAVLRHVKGSRDLFVYFSKLTEDEPTRQELSKAIETVSDATIVLGSTNAGTSNAIGWLHYAKLWYGDLGDDVCKKIANWPREKTSLEVIGTGGATTSGGTKTNIDLIHSGLLCGPHVMYNSSTDSAKKGWPESDMRAWMQKRYLAALPAALRAMLEEVQVKSVIYGDGTVAGAQTVDSVDKVYLPCYQDMFGGSTEIYMQCGKQIPWITTNALRLGFYGLSPAEDAVYTTSNSTVPETPKRGDVWSGKYLIWNGHCWVDAQSYWLRDAYPSSTSNFHYVSYGGYSYSGNSPTRYGVRPRLHL